MSNLIHNKICGAGCPLCTPGRTFRVLGAKLERVAS
jgi:hypothetical protein